MSDNTTSEFDNEVARIGKQRAIAFFVPRIIVGIVLCMIAGALIHG